MTLAPFSHHIPARGLVHHLLEWSCDGAEATAVLVHGFADAAGTFDLVAPRLVAAGLRVLAPDMRGFGRGPRLAAGAYYYFPDYVADLEALVRLAVPDAEPLFLVGHSMGGTIAALFAGAFPERVTKLALLEGAGPPDNPFAAAPDRMRRWADDLVRAEGDRARTLRPLGTMDDALRRLAMNHPQVPLDVLRTRLPHLVTPLDDGRVAWAMDPLHRTTSPIPFYAEAFRAFASRVTAPVLFIGGGAEGYHPPDEATRIAAFARVTHTTLEGAGHMMHWTRPEALGDELVAFWKASG